jgi:hypothetical protein
VYEKLTYNPNYTGDRHRRRAVQGQLHQTLVRPYFRNKLDMGHTPVIPATQQAKVGESWFEASLGRVSSAQDPTEPRIFL